MTWFKVDDKLHSHLKVMGAGDGEATRLAAMGLWVLAGSYCADYMTDGVIDRVIVKRLSPKRGEKLADALVDAGLWHPHERGWRFHDWADHQPLKSEVVAERERKSAAGRIGGLRSGEARASRSSRPPPQAEPKQVLHEREAGASALLPEVPNSRPDPSRPDPSGGEGASAQGPAPRPAPTATTEPSASGARLRIARPPEPIPDDFAVTDETVARCLMAARPDPRPLVDDFVAHHRSKQTLSASWQDELFKWAGRQERFDRGRKPSATSHNELDDLPYVDDLPEDPSAWRVAGGKRG